MGVGAEVPTFDVKVLDDFLVHLHVAAGLPQPSKRRFTVAAELIRVEHGVRWWSESVVVAWRFGESESALNSNFEKIMRRRSVPFVPDNE